MLTLCPSDGQSPFQMEKVCLKRSPALSRAVRVGEVRRGRRPAVPRPRGNSGCRDRVGLQGQGGAAPPRPRARCPGTQGAGSARLARCWSLKPTHGSPGEPTHLP